MFLQTKRFLEEVKNSSIGFTGMKFFLVTRKLMLTVMGTIFTYDLVLSQFHAKEAKDTDPCF